MIYFTSPWYRHPYSTLRGRFTRLYGNRVDQFLYQPDAFDTSVDPGGRHEHLHDKEQFVQADPEGVWIR